ncbi:carbamoyltransferase [Pseudochelatococcus lubricantis]|uniref:Carbamoyltransferase n=1 Tax=Pseudochelatococcus lubricantis TaxID=1538102 RepID=A0ABX0V6H5_9HYPH|nr:carbamoyltransferase C-terminal domain-containing protein [Pseudochelatococcus lubricantis]NIJ60178.1 carbamoyltransferase [Pseudochelatococcus lubricantis]
MSVILGIHVGHDSSCTVLKDGGIVSALQQERVSRRKHDGEEVLSNRLPITACLDTAGVNIDDVEFIISSFQSVADASFGLHKPLIEYDFNIFDPFDCRHYVISHHLAHAWHAYAGSGFPDSAVLVVDRAGSSTAAGEDYAQPFSEWYEQITTCRGEILLKTESLSIYDAVGDNVTLSTRRYNVPHIQPLTFICSAAGLYDNVSRRIFGSEHAHGQLMALASLASSDIARRVPRGPLVNLDETWPVFRNDWQHILPPELSVEEQVNLAKQCQSAFGDVMARYTHIALELTGRRKLAVAGGAFLNIVVNRDVADRIGPENYFVPSAPSDAGISMGCAYYGCRVIAKKPTLRLSTDRLGPIWSEESIKQALHRFQFLLEVTPYDREVVVQELVQGKIIGRWYGRSEFGPRALGARSIFANPMFVSAKKTLNDIKGRQEWRPVAPIVIRERAHEFFVGPLPSQWMTFAHTICEGYIDSFGALAHADGSTRVQTLEEAEDPELHSILTEFADRTGIPALVNTSMNGPNQPIVESPAEAIEFFIRSCAIDGLILGNYIARRRDVNEVMTDVFGRARLAPAVIISLVSLAGEERLVVTSPYKALNLDGDMLSLFQWLRQWRTMPEISAHLEALGADGRSFWPVLIAGVLELDWSGEGDRACQM